MGYQSTLKIYDSKLSVIKTHVAQRAIPKTQAKQSRDACPVHAPRGASPPTPPRPPCRRFGDALGLPRLPPPPPSRPCHRGAAVPQWRSAAEPPRAAARRARFARRRRWRPRCGRPAGVDRNGGEPTQTAGCGPSPRRPWPGPPRWSRRAWRWPAAGAVLAAPDGQGPIAVRTGTARAAGRWGGGGGAPAALEALRPVDGRRERRGRHGPWPTGGAARPPRRRGRRPRPPPRGAAPAPAVATGVPCRQTPVATAGAIPATPSAAGGGAPPPPRPS